MHKKSIAQIILILSPSIVLVALGMDIIIPCIPEVAKSLVTTFATAQWVLSAYFIGTGLGQIVIGPLADYFGRRKVMLCSILVFVSSSIACSFADTIGLLIFGRLLQGMGACGATVVVMAVIRDLFDDNTTPKAYSYVNSVTAIAPILAPLLGGYLLLWFGSWRSSFDFVAIFGLIAFFVNFLYLAETKPESNNIKLNFIKDYKEILSNIEFLGFTFCAITGLSSLFLFFSISPILMIDTLAIKPNIYGYYFGLNFLIYLAGNITSPRLQARMNVDSVIQLGNLVILFGSLFMLSWHNLLGLSLMSLLLPAMVVSFGVGIIYGPCMAKAMKSFRHIAGTASACYGALLYCSSALVVVVVMQQKIIDTLPFAITVALLACVSMLIVLGLHRSAK